MKLASCIGARFDVEVIEYLTQQWRARFQNESFPEEEKPIEEVLWQAVDEGLLEEVCTDPLGISASLQYKFTHDKVIRAGQPNLDSFFF